MDLEVRTSALLLIFFALLGSGTVDGNKQVNIPVRQFNNGTSKNNANSHVISVQYSNGSSSPHLAPERRAQISVAWSSNSTNRMEISTSRPDVANIKVFPVRKVTKPLADANMKTSLVPMVSAKTEVSPTHKRANPLAIPYVQISSTNKSTNPVTVNTKSTVIQVQHPTVQEPSFQQTIVSKVTYPDCFISTQIPAASLTTPSPDRYVKSATLQQNSVLSSYPIWQTQPRYPIDRSYSAVSPVYVKTADLHHPQVQSSSWQLQSQPYTDITFVALNPTNTKPDVLQQTAATISSSSWQLQQTQSPIHRSYSVTNPAYANSAILQPTAIPQSKRNLQLLQMSIDRAYSSVYPARYYPYNTLRQSTLVEYTDKRNHKYKQYNLSRQPSKHRHGSDPLYSVHSQPYRNYYTRWPPIKRENSPFFKPYPTKHVNFPPNRFPTPYNGLLSFSRHRPNGKDSPYSSGSSGTMYYKLLFPLALLGISIPALGMMYTYLSKRRRRSADGLVPSMEDVEYYMQMLQKALETYKQNDS